MQGLDIAAVSAKLRAVAGKPMPGKTHVITDAGAYLQLAEKIMSAGEFPPLAIEKLDKLLDEFVPPPSQSRPTYTEAIAQLENLIDSRLIAAGDLLALLPWEERWVVFSALARKGPGLETRSYLRLFYDGALHQVNFDQTLIAAAAAELLLHDKRTVSRSNYDVFAKLGERLVYIDAGDALEILEHMGLDPLAAEGAMAAIDSVATDPEYAGDDFEPNFAPRMKAAGAVGSAMMAATTPPPWTPPPNMPFGDWTKPKNMPFWFYIGNYAHNVIAAYYLTKHSQPEHIVHLNTSPILSIIHALEAAYDFKAGRIRKALSRSKPDIFDFSMAHGLPPGWVYEIKPMTLAKVAEFEALFYATALTLANVPVLPGPVNVDGTFGTVPGPGGWFQFWTPAPGAIVYKWRQASRRQVEERKQQRLEQKKMESLAPIAAALGLSIGTVAILAVILEFIEVAGWIIIFATP